MIAFEGEIKGNTVIVDNDDISAYSGNKVIITVLNGFSLTQNDKSKRPSKRVIDDKRDGQTQESSFQKILRLKKGFHFDQDFDAEKELEEALKEKYGSFD